MLSFEIQIAEEAAQLRDGKPRLLPVRVGWEGPRAAPLATRLDRYQYALWRGPEDNAALAAELLHSLTATPPPAARSRQFEAPGGAVPLDSRFYLERPTDEEFLTALARHDSIVLIEGARQMGKTSLLSRGLQQARRTGAKVVFTDFQKFNTADLATLDTFYKTLGAALADQLDLDTFPEDTWRAQRGPNQNFERYLRTEILGKIDAPLIWGLDEVDRLFSCSFASEVFGLFRSWHNSRATDPAGPWSRLTQVIAYATEAHLFITDLNQSPFNVGTRLRLRDFTLAEIAELNRRHGEPLHGEADLAGFHRLFKGQPYLVRRGLHEMASRHRTAAELAGNAAEDSGPFGDHLRRFLVLLSRDADLLAAVRGLLGTPRLPPEYRLFHRLRSAGLLVGERPADAGFRCEIYETYLRHHLP